MEKLKLLFLLIIIIFSERPEIESDPEDVVVNFGDDAMFRCVSKGEPTPEIVWYRDSAVLPIDNSRYEVMENGTLMVHNADQNDIGVFECSAKNPAGEVKSKPAKMMVQIKPDNNGKFYGEKRKIIFVKLLIMTYICK